MSRLWVSYAPHKKSKQNINDNYYILILVAGSIAASCVNLFGYLVLVSCFGSALCAFLTDIIFKWVKNKKLKVDEISSLYVGLVIGLAMPTGAMWYIPMIVSVFVTIFIKNVCGGVGNNFVSEVAVAKVLAYLIFGSAFYRFIDPNNNQVILNQATIDGIIGNSVNLPSVKELLLTTFVGGIGECLPLALLICAIILGIFKLIDIRISAFYLIFTFVFAYLFFGLNSSIMLILTSGVIFVAVFVVTDFGSAPKTLFMKFLISVVEAFLTVLCLKYGNYVLAPYYAVIVGGLINATYEGIKNGLCSVER